MKYKLLVILGVFLVSFAAIFVKLVNINPSVMAMYRLGIGGLILLPFSIFNNKSASISFSHYKIIFWAGLMTGLHYLTWFTSLQYTSVTSSTLIICSEPLVVLVFGYLLYRDKITRKQFLILLMALIGIGIVTWGDIALSKEALLGDVLTFIAVIFFVIYLFISQNTVKKLSFISYTSLLFICAGIILLIYNLICGYNLFNFKAQDWLIIILLAIIPNAGQVMFNYTLKFVKPSLIATSILLEPIFATILAVIFLDDRLSLNQIIGGIIIIASVYIYLYLDQLQLKKAQKNH